MLTVVDREVVLAEERSKNSVTRAELNRHIRTAVKRFDLSRRDETTWAFLCECGSEGCQEWVTLDLGRYEELLRAEEPILAPGHTLSDGQRIRRKARRLGEDAEALRAQAEHQIKRAKRNLGEEAHP